jgi:hypothetical protein
MTQPTLNPERPISASIVDKEVYVKLADGRLISNPLEWHTWLANATPEQQVNVELYPTSVFWPDLDEGLDIQGMLMGNH